MHLRAIRIICICIIALIAAALLLVVFTKQRIFWYVEFGLVMAYGLFNQVFWRCPICGKPFGGIKKFEKCPFCGSEIDT